MRRCWQGRRCLSATSSVRVVLSARWLQGARATSCRPVARAQARSRTRISTAPEWVRAELACMGTGRLGRLTSPRDGNQRYRTRTPVSWYRHAGASANPLSRSWWRRAKWALACSCAQSQWAVRSQAIRGDARCPHPTRPLAVACTSGRPRELQVSEPRDATSVAGYVVDVAPGLQRLHERRAHAPPHLRTTLLSCSGRGDGGLRLGTTGRTARCA